MTARRIEDGFARSAAEEMDLAVIAEEFPGVRVDRVRGGYEALPNEVQAVRAVNTGELLRRLRERRDGTGQEEQR